MKTQQEESAYRRNAKVEFPQPIAGCETCHETVWTDQGHVMVKSPKWTEENMWLHIHHDDCYEGKKPFRSFKRTSKTKLEPEPDDTVHSEA